jgi:NAD(P)-dependent dehydrogenase (short-subunit alcohol dehydrogenase family)
MWMAQVVIVTGASRGLGAAVAQHVAELGADVVLAARSPDELERQADLIRQKGREALVVLADLSKPQDCRSLVQQAQERFGNLHALINNGGVLEPIAAIAQADPQDWQRNWQVNVLAPVLLAQASLPALRSNGGLVVNVSSGAAEKVTPGWASYSLAKAALNHLTRFLAQEEPEITAIAVRPGMVDTAMQAAIRQQGEVAMRADDYQRFVGYYEQGKLLPPPLPGRALACLALFAPHAWSGEYLSWDEERVQALVEEHA